MWSRDRVDTGREGQQGRAVARVMMGCGWGGGGSAIWQGSSIIWHMLPSAYQCLLLATGAYCSVFWNVCVHVRDDNDADCCLNIYGRLPPAAGEGRGSANQEEIREEAQDPSAVDAAALGSLRLQPQGPQPVRLPQLGRRALLSGLSPALDTSAPPHSWLKGKKSVLRLIAIMVLPFFSFSILICNLKKRMLFHLEAVGVCVY